MRIAESYYKVAIIRGARACVLSAVFGRPVSHYHLNGEPNRVNSRNNPNAVLEINTYASNALTRTHTHTHRFARIFRVPWPHLVRHFRPRNTLYIFFRLPSRAVESLLLYGRTPPCRRDNPFTDRWARSTTFANDTRMYIYICLYLLYI